MRILLLGGSGLLGGPALDVFLADGHEVTVATRGQRRITPAPALKVHSLDRRDRSALERALRAEHFDFTVDFLAYDDFDLDALFAIPDFSPGRFVMISTGQVYLVAPDARPPFREADADRAAMDEPERDTRAWHNWVYGMGKRRAEARLRLEASERGLRTLALRLPVVQGESDARTSGRLWAWLQRFRDGGPVLLPDDGVQPVRFVYAADVANALVRVARAETWPEAHALNLAQPEEESLKYFLTRTAHLAGVEPRFVPIDADALTRAGLADACAPYWGRWCSRPDPSLALNAYGLRTRGPEEYLPSVVRAHLADPPRELDPDYARRADEIELARGLSV